MSVVTTTEKQREDSPIPKLKPKDFKGKVKPDWCPGCGDFGVLSCLQKACAQLGLRPHEILTVRQHLTFAGQTGDPFFVQFHAGQHGLEDIQGRGEGVCRVEEALINRVCIGNHT